MGEEDRPIQTIHLGPKQANKMPWEANRAKEPSSLTSLERPCLHLKTTPQFVGQGALNAGPGLRLARPGLASTKSADQDWQRRVPSTSALPSGIHPANETYADKSAPESAKG